MGFKICDFLVGMSQSFGSACFAEISASPKPKVDFGRKKVSAIVIIDKYRTEFHPSNFMSWILISDI